MKYLAHGTLVAVAAIVGFVVGNAGAPEPVNTVQTVTVTVPERGELLIREVYETLVIECRKVPWKYDPPQRPTCEEMAMMGTVQLILNGRMEGPQTPSDDI